MSARCHSDPCSMNVSLHSARMGKNTAFIITTMFNAQSHLPCLLMLTADRFAVLSPACWRCTELNLMPVCTPHSGEHTYTKYQVLNTMMAVDSGAFSEHTQTTYLSIGDRLAPYSTSAPLTQYGPECRSLFKVHIRGLGSLIRWRSAK